MDQVPQEVIFNPKNVSSEAQNMLETFWLREITAVQNMTMTDFRTQELPLARIKKIMKLDEDVKMISGEAPVLFAKAVEMFISELSLRAWVNTEENKRRTLQRNDIAMAITKYDQFDFLIDIVPREEAKPSKRTEPANSSQNHLNYFIQYAQQLQSGGQSVPIMQPSNQGQSFGVPQIFQVPLTAASNQASDSSSLANSSIVQIGNTTNSQNTTDKSNLAPIILSNVYNNSGEIIQQLPLSHYQTILQSQNSGQSQSIIINPQSLPVQAQYITNSGQLVQTILPSTSNIETQLEANKVVSQNDNSGS